MSFVVASLIACSAAVGCQRRLSELGADASTTSATVPAGGERPASEGATDAGATAATAPAEPAGAADAEAPEPLPRWVPRRAPLTIVEAADRDRNLGIGPGGAGAVTVDAGPREIDITIRAPR